MSGVAGFARIGHLGPDRSSPALGPFGHIILASERQGRPSAHASGIISIQAKEGASDVGASVAGGGTIIVSGASSVVTVTV